MSTASSVDLEVYGDQNGAKSPFLTAHRASCGHVPDFSDSLEGAFSEVRQDEERGSITDKKWAGASIPRPSVLPSERASRYELALILRSICSMRVSRFLLRFSYSRTFLSSSAERPS